MLPLQTKKRGKSERWEDRTRSLTSVMPKQVYERKISSLTSRNRIDGSASSKSGSIIPLLDDLIKASPEIRKSV